MAGDDANAPVFNDFCVPIGRGTSLGQSWDTGQRPRHRDWYSGTAGTVVGGQWSVVRRKWAVSSEP